MTNLLRKHQQTLLIILTVIIIIAFVGFWNTNQRSGGFGTTGGVAKIYGHSVTQTDLERASRRFEVAAGLQMIDLLRGLCGQSSRREEAVENFIWNSMVLRHEAEALQINPTAEEMREAGQRIPAFQKNNVFDETQFQAVVAKVLAPNGFSEHEIDELVADELRLKKLHALLDSTVELSPTEVRADYDLEHRKYALSVIRFLRADFAATINVTDEETKKAFDAQKENLISEEKRAVKFVAFMLTDEEKKLTAKERTTALQQVAIKARQFAQEMTDKNAKFDEIAAKNQTPVMTTPPFSMSAPDPQTVQTPALIAETFHRTKEDPNSDPIRAENGFYVLQLQEIVPGKALTYEEAKPRLVEQIKSQRATEMMTLKANEIRTKIEADTKAGKSFADAAKIAGVKVEQIPPLSIAEPNSDKPDSELYLEKALELSEGDLSEPVPNSDSTVLIHLDKREPVDESKWEQEKGALTERALQMKRELLFQEWLRSRREAAKIEVNGRGR